MSKTNYWEKFEENSVYHLYNRGIDGTTVFKLDKNYPYFLEKWKNLIHPYFDTFAYCLMPNHVHFLIKVKPVSVGLLENVKSEGTVKSRKFLEGTISHNVFLEDQFKRLFSSYALAFNKQENRTGSLFQKRFKRVSIKNEFRLWHILAYIHHNPIHHKFCRSYGEWKYCSYAAFLTNTLTLLTRSEVLSWFHFEAKKQVEAFLAYHEKFKIDKNNFDYLEG